MTEVAKSIPSRNTPQAKSSPTDERVGDVAEAARPVRPGDYRQAWAALEAWLAEIQIWVKQGLTVVKIGVLLERRGVAVPYRTVHRFRAERCDYARPGP
jgi:hypothetical protein